MKCVGNVCVCVCVCVHGNKEIRGGSRVESMQQCRDLPHVEVADDYPGVHFRVVTAKVLPYVGVLPVENAAVEHWRVSTAFYVREQLGPGEVPNGVVAHETCELPLVIVRRRTPSSERTGRTNRTEDKKKPRIMTRD